MAVLTVPTMLLIQVSLGNSIPVTSLTRTRWFLAIGFLNHRTNVIPVVALQTRLSWCLARRRGASGTSPSRLCPDATLAANGSG